MSKRKDAEEIRETMDRPHWNEWLFSLALFIVFLILGVVLFIFTSEILASPDLGLSNLFDRAQAGWAQSLLDVSVALAGSAAAILLAMTAMRQSGGMNKLQQKANNRQRAIQNIEVWHAFIRSLDELQDAAETAVSAILDAHLDGIKPKDARDWINDEGQEVYQDLRLKRASFLKAIQDLEALPIKLRLSKSWAQCFIGKAERSVSFELLLAADFPVEKIRYNPEEILNYIYQLSRAGSFSPIIFERLVATVLGVFSASEEQAAKAILAEARLATQAQFEKVKPDIDEIYRFRNEASANSHEQEHLWLEIEKEIENGSDFGERLADKIGYPFGDLDEASLERLDEILEDLRRERDSFCPSGIYWLGSDDASIGLSDDDASESEGPRHINDAINTVKRIMELQSAIEVAKENESEITDALGETATEAAETIAAIARTISSARDIVSQREVKVALFLQEREQALRHEDQVSAWDLSVGSVISSLVLPHEISLKYSKRAIEGETGVYRLNLGLAILCDLCRAVPHDLAQHVDTLYTDLGSFGLSIRKELGKVSARCGGGLMRTVRCVFDAPVQLLLIEANVRTGTIVLPEVQEVPKAKPGKMTEVMGTEVPFRFGELADALDSISDVKERDVA